MRIIEHSKRRSKGTQKILLTKGIDAVFYPNSSVTLCQHSRWHPDETYPAMGCGSSIPHHINQRSPSNSQHIRMTTEAIAMNSLLYHHNERHLIFDILSTIDDQRRTNKL